ACSGAAQLCGRNLGENCGATCRHTRSTAYPPPSLAPVEASTPTAVRGYDVRRCQKLYDRTT
ncbi:TPA: hypothetical protein N0F65_008203, partial [Lagenidium giganteum]